MLEKNFWKSLTMLKKLRGRTLWDILTSIFQHPSQKVKGEPFVGNFFFKVAQCRKNLKGDPFVLSGIVCYAGNVFGSVPWANRYILAFSGNFVELLVELFCSDQVVSKNTDEKPRL